MFYVWIFDINLIDFPRLALSYIRLLLSEKDMFECQCWEMKLSLRSFVDLKALVTLMNARNAS